MKRCIIGFYLTLSFPIILSSQTPDEVAIQQLLESETKDFLAMPMSEVAKRHWKLDDQTLMVVTKHDGSRIERGRDSILAVKVRRFPAPTDVVKTDHFVHINGTSAFASHEQIFIDRQTGDKTYSHEIRVLAKVDGAWKIHVSNVHQYKKG
jgi:hypothetical protein